MIIKGINNNEKDTNSKNGQTIINHRRNKSGKISYEVEGEAEDEFFKDNKFLSDENLERLNNEYFKKVEKENTDEEIEKTEEVQNDKEVEETVKDLAEDLEEKEKEEDVFKKEEHIGRSRNWMMF